MKEIIRKPGPECERPNEKETTHNVQMKNKNASKIMKEKVSLQYFM